MSGSMNSDSMNANLVASTLSLLIRGKDDKDGDAKKGKKKGKDKKDKKAKDKKDKKDKDKKDKKGKDKKDKKAKDKKDKKDKKGKDKSDSKKKDKKSDKKDGKEGGGQSPAVGHNEQPKKAKSQVKVEVHKERELAAQELRRGLDLKKRLVELWDKVAKDPTASKSISSPDVLLKILDQIGFVEAIVNHIAQKNPEATEGGRSISTFHLAEATRSTLARSLFSYMDVDGNQSISLNELLFILDAMMDPEPSERSRFHFIMMDSDGNGILEGDELRRLMGLHALAMKIAFEFDLTALVRDGGASDADSTLVRVEMSKHVFDNPSFVDYGVRELLAAADSNHDGTLQEAEWLSWATNKTSLQKYTDQVVSLVHPVLALPAVSSNRRLIDLINRSLAELKNFI